MGWFPWSGSSKGPTRREFDARHIMDCHLAMANAASYLRNPFMAGVSSEDVIKELEETIKEYR